MLVEEVLEDALVELEELAFAARRWRRWLCGTGEGGEGVAGAAAALVVRAVGRLGDRLFGARCASVTAMPRGCRCGGRRRQRGSTGARAAAEQRVGEGGEQRDGTKATIGSSRRSVRSALTDLRNSVMGSPWTIGRERSGSRRGSPVVAGAAGRRGRRWRRPVEALAGGQHVGGGGDVPVSSAAAVAAPLPLACRRSELDALDRQQPAADLQAPEVLRMAKR